MSLRRPGIAAALLVSTLAAGTAARAGSLAVREQSAAATGLAGAGTAAGSAGLPSMFWNPATMTGLAGTNASGELTGILPSFAVTPEAGTSPYLLEAGGHAAAGDLAYPAAVPAGYASHEVGDGLWVGVATNAPFGLRGKLPADWAGQVYGRTSSVSAYDVNPDVAYRVNDWLSLGAGLQVTYARARLSQAMSPLPGAPSATLDGDGTGLGYTLGVLVTPWAGTQVGVGYRSGVDARLGGHLALDGAQRDSNTGRILLQAGRYGTAVDIPLPGTLTVGVRQAVSERLTLDAGYEFVDWSRFGRLRVAGTDGPTKGATMSSLGFGYRDGHTGSLGAEYRWDGDILLRGGVSYERSPVDDANRGVRLPDGDRVALAGGLNYRLTANLSLDLAYSHSFVLVRKVSIVAGNPAYVTASRALPDTDFQGKVSGGIDVASVGFNYRF